jgi:hypothetical protein
LSSLTAVPTSAAGCGNCFAEQKTIVYVDVTTINYGEIKLMARTVPAGKPVEYYANVPN